MRTERFIRDNLFQEDNHSLFHDPLFEHFQNLFKVLNKPVEWCGYLFAI